MAPELTAAHRLRCVWLTAWLLLCTVHSLRAVDWPNPVDSVDGEPHRYIGFIYDTKIYATAFVAGDQRLIVSGAHVFTDDYGNMEPTDSFRFVRRLHQSTAPTYEGETIRAAIIYTGPGGYASLLDEHGLNSLKAFSQDIGVAYGYHPMSDGGALTFLDDGAQQLKSLAPKKIIGYPIGLYSNRIRSSSSPDRFKMHETRVSTTWFKQVFPGDDRLLEDAEESLDNTPLASIPGNSGGPIVVETSPGHWAAAGILVAGYSEIPLTYNSSSSVWAGTSIIRTLHADDWTGLVEPALDQAIGKPVFDVHPVDTTILPGQSGQLYGNAEGYGEISYQWFKNDKAFAGQTSPWLQFDAAQPPQGGTYELRATNPFGTTRSNPAVLTVPTGPVITKQPQSFTLSYGSRGYFRFEFYAAEVYEIKFYRNGVKLDDWLRVPEYHIYSEGEYYATVTNSWGQAQTDTITVNIEVDSTYITGQPEGGDREAGQPINLRVDTRNRDNTIQWYKDGEILPGAIYGYLDLIVRGPEDEGDYYAIVDTGLGLLQSRVATIRVEEAPPRILNYVPATLARIGAPARLAAAVGGTPPLAFQWSFKGRILPGAEGPYLDLPDVTASDFGAYSCRVTNRLGSVTAEGIELKSGLDPFWTPLRIPSKFSITDLAQNDTLMVATTRSGILLTSPDALNWTEHELSRVTEFKSITWGAGRFVAVGRGIIAASSNGTDWEVTANQTDFVKIHYGNGIFLASAEHKGLFTSPNGLGWSHVLAPETDWSPYDTIATGDGQYVASTGLFLATSPDAKSWTVREWQSLSGQPVNSQAGDIIHAGDRFLAIANSDHLIASVDGIDWTVLQPDGFGSNLGTDGNLFVAGSYQGLDRISSDSNTWEPLIAHSLEEASRYYVFKGRVLVFTGRGSGVVSPDLSSPIRVIRPPAPQYAFAHRSAHLEVTHMHDPSVTYQWFNGPTGDLALPVAGATSASLEVGPSESGNYWVRLTRGGDTWDSEVVPVHFIAPGYYLDADDNHGSAVMLSESGALTMVAYDNGNRSITSMPTGAVGSGNDGMFRGATYGRTGYRLHYRQSNQEGRFESDSFSMNTWTGSVYENSEIPRKHPGGTPHPAAGFYRFALVGRPYCEGSAIVDETGTAVVVMHTTDEFMGGTGQLSAGDVVTIDAEADRHLSLEFDPIRATVSGTFARGYESIPLSGLRGGSEALAGLANLSSRGQVRTGDGILIAGLVLKGPDPARLLVRGIGPTLADFDVPDALANPGLKVIRDETLLAENDDWGDFADPVALAAARQQAGAFPLGNGSRDAALIMTTEPGRFTVHVEGTDAGTGTALAEVYHLRDSGQPAASEPRLLNLSIRGFAGRTGNPLVIGFVIDGDRPRQVFVRAVGPSLARYGLEDFLPDPELTLFQGDQALASAPTPSDDLPEDYEINLAVIASTIGAFLPVNREPTLAVWLEPGAYTAVVQPAYSPGGIALVEIYEIPFDAPSN